MNSQLIEFLLGIYFVGISIAVTKTAPTYTKTVDLFKLVLGIVLIVLAFIQGVRFI